MVVVAQLVEPRFVVPMVAGSSPVYHPRFTLAADKEYDDEKLHDYLEENNIFSAITLKDTRLTTREGEFKNRNDDRYFRQYMDPGYEQGQRIRYKVEQPYAEMKRYFPCFNGRSDTRKATIGSSDDSRLENRC